MTFCAERLKEARERKGLSQRELAAKIKVSQASISWFESGDTIPSGNKIGLLADALDVSIDYLYGRGE